MDSNFVNTDKKIIYLDGNSLGRLPAETPAAVSRVVEKEWGGELIEAWEHWIDEPVRLGELLGREFLGAEPGSVVISDSTTVNFYKLAAAAISFNPDRKVVITDKQNFPTDRYVLESLTATHGAQIRWIDSDPIEGPQVADVARLLDAGTALVTFSHVAYRSAAIADMQEINAAAHEAGALTLWDLSHSVGAIPIELQRTSSDLAVGCTYKYLNGGPGSPAFLYVHPELQAKMRQPVWGWFGQRDQFAMGQGYDPVQDIRRFQSGSPPIIALAATRSGLESLAAIGMDTLRARSVQLNERLITLARERLFPLGFALGSPTAPERRGGHVLLTHPQAKAISVAMRRFEQVIGDFREPDGLRLSPVAAYSSEGEVAEAVRRIARLVSAGRHLEIDSASSRVT